MANNFNYVGKKDQQVKDVYNNLIEILKKVQDVVREDFTFKFKPVGSYSRNMITCDKNSNVGFDIDIDIEVNDDNEKHTAAEIKNIIIEALNKIAVNYGYSYAENSIRVITIKKIDSHYSRIIHSCDLAIVHNYNENGRSMQQYIHFNKKEQTYYWRNQKNGYYMIPKKIEWLKSNYYWEELREYYLKKKNINTNNNIPSRILFAIAVHEMCQKKSYYL